MQPNKARRMMILSAMIMVSALLAHAAVDDAQKLLEGTKWKVKMVPDKATADKGGKEFTDEWIFTDGKFSTVAMAKEGFKPSTYKLESEPGEIEFEIEQSKAVMATNDVVIWNVTIQGTNATGGLQWKKKVNGDFLYDLTGTKE
jgi:hypothetical protein